MIGVDDLEPPRWASVDEQVAKAGLWQTVRELPSAAAVVVRLAWATAPRLTALAVVVQLASGAATAFGLFATANAFSALLESGPTPQRVLASLPAIAAVVVAFAVRGLFESLAGAVQGTLTPRVRHAAQAELNAAVASVQLITWEDADFRELARQGGYQGVTAVEASVRGVSEVLASMVALVAALITTGLLSIWLVPVLLLATTADALASMHAAKLGYRSFLAMVTRRMRLHVVEALLVARDVAAERTALNLQGTLLAEHQRVAEEVTSEAIRLERRKTVVRLLGRTLSGIGSGAAYVVLGTLLYLGIMPLAVAGTAVVAMRTAASALSRTMVAVNRLYEHSFYIGFFQKLLQEARAHHPVPTARTAPLDPEIRLEKVSFRYPGQETYALQDIDLMVRPGEVIALVGENGSGKTTLGKVLVGLYPPTSGRVWWDDVDLSTADPGSIHSRIAIIAQDPARWPMTAALNIRIGRLERAPSHDALWREAISRSGADEVLASLPHGEHTIVSRQFRGGQDLSGGQWQRLSVARGIYRNAAILVADEPTAALDAKAEALVFAGLQHASSTHDSTNGQRNTKTTVLITHRLANIAQADRIIVLEQGRIVETGTHAELIGLAGRYHEMYSLQAQQFSIPAQEAPHSSPLVDG